MNTILNFRKERIKQDRISNLREIPNLIKKKEKVLKQLAKPGIGKIFSEMKQKQLEKIEYRLRKAQIKKSKQTKTGW